LFVCKYIIKCYVGSNIPSKKKKKKKHGSKIKFSKNKKLPCGGAYIKKRKEKDLGALRLSRKGQTNC
jgi:hypothetical protein